MKRLLMALFSLCALAVSADDSLERGEHLYNNYCTQCHGINGDGKGINIRDMAVQPRDHTDRSEMSARSDADLIKAIKGGGKAINKSVLMPAWKGNLNDQQVDELVSYLRQLCCQE